MFRHLIMICAIALFGAANANAQSTAFIGTWEWTGSVYVLGGTESPATTGHTRQLKFAEDHEYIRYEDSQIVHAGNWEIVDVYVPPVLIAMMNTSDGHSWLGWEISMDPTPVMTMRNWSEWPASTIDSESRTEYYVLRDAVPTEVQSWGTVKAGYR